MVGGDGEALPVQSGLKAAGPPSRWSTPSQAHLVSPQQTCTEVTVAMGYRLAAVDRNRRYYRGGACHVKHPRQVNRVAGYLSVY